jgi:hypothetical protein
MINENQFQEFILQHRVAVVHFSHHARMNHDVQFPSDLNHALETWQSETRSCCALWPGHAMNLPGSVGVIYRPSSSNVLSVLNTDSGSSYYNGQEGSFGDEPSEDSLTRSLNEVPSHHYNEWRLLGAPPMGIFVADTSQILVKKWVTPRVPEGLTLDEIEPILVCCQIRLDVVMAAFSHYDIYTLGEQGLVLLRGGDSF